MEVNVTDLLEHSESLEDENLTLREAMYRIRTEANMRYNMTGDMGWLNVYNWANKALEVK
jgi:hypothetical protein